MEDELISFETAKLAKEKGFREDTIDWWAHRDTHWIEEYPESYDFGLSDHNEYPYKLSRPTQSLLQRWLREEHELFVLAHFGMQHGGWSAAYCKKGWTNYERLSPLVETYEDALEMALKEALNLITHE